LFPYQKGRGGYDSIEFSIQLDPNFGNWLVRQKRVAKIEFCQKPTIDAKIAKNSKTNFMG
jgi:hypothetical protein